MALSRWLLAVPAILLILLGCGQVGMSSARVPVRADTRSGLHADYSPWPFVVVKPLNPAVYEVIQADMGDEIALASPVPGGFWATATATVRMATPTPGASATAMATNVPVGSATGTETVSSETVVSTAAPSRTPTALSTVSASGTATQGRTAVPSAPPSATATRTRTLAPTATRTRTPLPTQGKTAGKNYRSIGTNAGTLFSAGNASIAQGSRTVTFGGGASLPGNVGVGDRLVIGGETFYVLSRDSAAQMTVQYGAVTAHASEGYTITRAYNTFQGWETDRQGNLAAEDRIEVGVAYDDGVFPAVADPMVLVDGSVTDASHYLQITVGPGQGHNGTAGTGVILDGQADTQIGIDVRDDYTRVDGLELIRFHHSTVDGAASVFARDANHVLFERLLIHDFNHPGMKTYGARTSVVAGTVDSFTIRNCIIYAGGAGGVHVGDAADRITVQNVTVYGMAGNGVNINQGSMTVTNTISMGNGSQDFRDAVGGMEQVYNMSEDGTAVGAGSLTGRDPSAQFVSIAAGSEDFHLSAGSNAVDAGTDLSGQFSDDVDQDARPQGAAWDMGADE